MTMAQITTDDSIAMQRLIRQMKADRLNNLLTTNDRDELIRVSLYEKNELSSNPNAHLVYSILHNNEQFKTIMEFDMKGNMLSSEIMVMHLG